MAVEQLIKDLKLDKIFRTSKQVEVAFYRESPEIGVSFTWDFEEDSPLIDGCYEFFSSGGDDVWRITELFYVENGQTWQWRISKASGHYWTWMPA